jgi:hypothetical protein
MVSIFTKMCLLDTPVKIFFIQTFHKPEFQQQSQQQLDLE